MPVAMIACPNADCRRQLSIDGLPPGQNVRCPFCSTTFRIPALTPTAEGLPSDTSIGAGSSAAPGQPAAGSDAPSMPATIGPYEVRQKLGEGAFGIVYRAYDPIMQREVAIKMLKANAVQSPQYLERFLREARL